VLTDVMMPGTSGLDLCRAIKEDPSLENIPVILLTARGENEAALEGYEAGADDFVSKPFHTKVLQARIRAHLKMRGLSLQLADQARLASAGTFAAGLAHEVKNPLNAAVNAAKVLAEGGSTRVSNERLIGLMIDALERIDGIVSALDAHARPADGSDLAPCNVRKAVESTLHLLEHKMKHVAVHEDYEVTGDVFAPARAGRSTKCCSTWSTTRFARVPRTSGSSFGRWTNRSPSPCRMMAPAFLPTWSTGSSTPSLQPEWKARGRGWGFI
ncbi:MAG: response regulator, partial [Deltaproteobacteria bacterium]|nr:response regulator [Deltaproteobacteria bacterium]